MKHFLKWIFMFFFLHSWRRRVFNEKKNLILFFPPHPILFNSFASSSLPLFSFFSILTSLRWGMSSSYYYFISLRIWIWKRQMLEGIWHQQRRSLWHNLIFQFLLAFPQNLSLLVVSFFEDMSSRINKNIKARGKSFLMEANLMDSTSFTLRDEILIPFSYPQFISPLFFMKLEILLRTF